LKRLLCILLTFAFVAASSPAAFHVMQIEEIIGSINGNTSAQAIQLRLRNSGQNLVSNAKLWAWDATGSNRVLLLDIASNVTNSASGARILLATSGFDSTMIAGGATTFSPDFVLANIIPSTYLTAGRITFEDDGGSPTTAGTIYWSVSWGGGSYTGGTTGSTTNDTDGDFGPAESSPLARGSLAGSFSPGLLFTGAAGALSTNNLADYAPVNVAYGGATVTRNNGASFAVVPEPGSTALIGAGALFLGGFAYFRRRQP
jgi:hypothetical protein